MNNTSVYSLNESQALSHAAERGNVPVTSKCVEYTLYVYSMIS